MVMMLVMLIMLLLLLDMEKTIREISGSFEILGDHGMGNKDTSESVLTIICSSSPTFILLKCSKVTLSNVIRNFNVFDNIEIVA